MSEEVFCTLSNAILRVWHKLLILRTINHNTFLNAFYIKKNLPIFPIYEDVIVSEPPNFSELMMNHSSSLLLGEALSILLEQTKLSCYCIINRLIPHPVNILWKENSWCMKEKLAHTFQDHFRLDLSLDYSKPQCFWLEYKTY